ncbi:MAG: restriction endonuclease subunit S, partial [Planctomycetota bacterium]|nr:restriction endonuclease subunit S [Planctomycetota bacterium]
RPRLMISDKIIRLHLITDIVPDFGALVLNTGHTSACIENLKSGMAASQMNISQPKLKSVPIPVPPKEEQLRILERVSQLLALVRKLAEQKLKQRLTSESFAKAAVAAITSTEFTESERMKPPRTEVVTALTPGRKPKNAALAPLAELLTFEIHLGVPKHGANSGTDGSLTAKELWRISELDIAQFYQQLKTEMANGWITEAKKAIVKEVEAR